MNGPVETGPRSRRRAANAPNASCLGGTCAPCGGRGIRERPPRAWITGAQPRRPHEASGGIRGAHSTFLMSTQCVGALSPCGQAPARGAFRPSASEVSMPWGKRPWPHGGRRGSRAAATGFAQAGEALRANVLRLARPNPTRPWGLDAAIAGALHHSGQAALGPASGGGNPPSHGHRGAAGGASAHGGATSPCMTWHTPGGARLPPKAGAVGQTRGAGRRGPGGRQSHASRSRRGPTPPAPRAWDTRVAMVGRANPEASPSRRLQWPGVQPPARSNPQVLAQGLHAADEPAPGRHPTAPGAAHRPLAHTRELACWGPEPGADARDQGLEPEPPEWGGQSGVRRSGPFQVRARTALPAATPPEPSRWVEHPARWGPPQSATGPRGLPGERRPAMRRKVAWTPLLRQRLVPTTYAPEAPPLQHDWRQRGARPHAMAYRPRHLAPRQHGRWPVCHQPLDTGAALQTHPVVPKPHGGTADLATLRLGHHHCPRQLHSTRAPLGVRRWREPCPG